MTLPTLNIPHFLIVHTSDSPFGDRDVIDGWHKQRGWTGIGYHYVILNGRPKTTRIYDPKQDGTIQQGRGESVIGSHCLGYNDKSIGICLIGVHGMYTHSQMVSLLNLLDGLAAKYNICEDDVLGHCETASGRAEGKTCPDLDMTKLRANLKMLIDKRGATPC